MFGVNTPICLPLGLAYLAATIRNLGFKVRCVDAVGEDPFNQIPLENTNFMSFGLDTPAIVKRVGKCDIIGVSLMFSHDWSVAKTIIQKVRENSPDTLIVCGGEHITAVPDFCLKDCPAIDICVLGEGEETISELMHSYELGTPLDEIKGIVYRSGDVFVSTGSRTRIRQLDDLAWPAWDLFPLENYLSNGLGYGVNPGRTIPLQVARGCPFQCTFCSSPQMWTTRWNVREVDEVIKEMEFYIKNYGAQNFDWYDLTSIVKKDWIVDFCEKVIAKNWGITWQMPSGTRSEALDQEVLNLMYRSGQRNISYAPESGSPATLKDIKKKIDLENMKISIKAALNEGMNVKLNLIMGFPRETKERIFETLTFIRDMALIGVHDINITCYAPYPGAEAFIELQNEGKVEMDDEYFYNLTSYTDLRHSRSYSDHIGDKALTVYRLGGFIIFYSISYLLRPIRFYRTIRNLLTGKEESRLDAALRGIVDRFIKKSSKLPT
jgi:radical SAM superfamily enzyme YgiQ (UPF0313 family)